MTTGLEGTVVNPYRYARYRYDSETGVYYLNARYYWAEVGRFITRDSFHGFVENPASLNKYVYCESNPTIFIDPDGNTVITAPLLPIAAIAALVVIAFDPVVRQQMVAAMNAAYSRATRWSQNKQPWKYLDNTAKIHIRQRHFTGYPSTIGKGTLYPKTWSESFIWDQVIKIANNKWLPQLKDFKNSNVFRIFPVISKGYSTLIKVVYNPWSGRITSAYPIFVSKKLW